MRVAALVLAGLLAPAALAQGGDVGLWWPPGAFDAVAPGQEVVVDLFVNATPRCGQAPDVREVRADLTLAGDERHFARSVQPSTKAVGFQGCETAHSIRFALRVQGAPDASVPRDGSFTLRALVRVGGCALAQCAEPWEDTGSAVVPVKIRSARETPSPPPPVEPTPSAATPDAPTPAAPPAERGVDAAAAAPAGPDRGMARWIPAALALAATGLGGGAWWWATRKPRARPSRDETPAALLKRYAIERELGRGAFGVVWLAKRRDDGARVVLKTLHPSWSADARTMARFRREAQILEGLRHANVTRFIGLERAGALTYLVMEYVDGGSLEDLMRAGPLPPAEAVRIAGGVLEGLEHVHAKGVLHRDLKPTNILLGADGRPKIADFGVARAVGMDVTGKTTIGTSPGTPMFMGPEQLTGGNGDERSDLFALGVVFHWAVSGRYHLGKHPTSTFELVDRLQRERSELPLDALTPALNAWLARALERDPARRWSSARAMREALEKAAGPAQRPPRFK